MAIRAIKPDVEHVLLPPQGQGSVASGLRNSGGAHDGVNPLRRLVKSGSSEGVWREPGLSPAERAALIADDIQHNELPHSFAVAIARYHDGIDRVFNLVTEGLAATDNVAPSDAGTARDAEVWKNTCEWLVEGKVKLYILAPFDCTLAPPLKRAEYPNHRVYFGGDIAIPLKQAKPMLPALQQYGSPEIQERNVRGAYVADAGKIVIVDPSLHKAHLKETLIRVVQDAVAHATPDTPAAKFRQQFTWRWLAGRHPKAAEVYESESKSRKLGFYSERQSNIVDDILAEVPELGEAWQDRSLDREAYRMRGPQTINPLNSIRIDRFWEALAQPTKSEARTEAMDGLNEHDKAAIVSQAELWCQFLRGLEHLSGSDKTSIAAKLQLPWLYESKSQGS